MLNWAQQFSIFCLLDNHQYQIEPHTIECMLAAGYKRIISAGDQNSLKALQEFINNKPSWLFGHLNYDLKNEIADLTSSHTDHIRFPDFFFFEPEIIIRLGTNFLTIECDKPRQVYNNIIQSKIERHSVDQTVPDIKSRMTKAEYIDIINKLRRHILRGDCYEINFCQEFFAENTFINPAGVYERLSEISPNPFSGLYKLNDKYLLCASPERFIKKNGQHILSQPIKGTARRIAGNSKEDEQGKADLYQSRKDRSENVMVVDLVRNDLSRVCKEGTVRVDELYGIYSFPQVYQMISTISGELKENIAFTEILNATFPMGSMTGAPKRSVLQLIEKYEKAKRGIFSGALGYITPEGDFDFNVVIRSIMYNASDRYLSFQAGSGITFYSDPENEWEECLLKAQAISKVLLEMNSNN
ncbi:MAG: anthranilate synthase component I family protein [Bacteroidota bacterium]